MTGSTSRYLLFVLVVGLTACSSRSVDTELTRCVFPDSARTPAPSFICGAEVSGFPVTALRSSEPSEQDIAERIDRVLQSQIEQWSIQWSTQWFGSEQQQLAFEFLRDWLSDNARVVRSRVSPKSTLWLLIGQPMTLADLEQLTKNQTSPAAK